MKKITFYMLLAVVWILSGILTPANAAPDAGACYVIGNADHRAMCLARAHGDPGRCYVIQAQDLRAQCIAEVRR